MAVSSIRNTEGAGALSCGDGTGGRQLRSMSESTLVEGGECEMESALHRNGTARHSLQQEEAGNEVVQQNPRGASMVSGEGQES